MMKSHPLAGEPLDTISDRINVWSKSNTTSNRLPDKGSNGSNRGCDLIRRFRRCLFRFLQCVGGLLAMFKFDCWLLFGCGSRIFAQNLESQIHDLTKTSVLLYSF